MNKLVGIVLVFSILWGFGCRKSPTQQEQPDAECSFTASPENITAPATTDNGNFALTASSPDCTWTATSDVDWITFRASVAGSDVGSSEDGSGSCSVSYTTHENTGTERTGHINVGNATVTIIQQEG
jgi:hypothetical protein